MRASVRYTGIAIIFVITFAIIELFSLAIWTYVLHGDDLVGAYQDNWSSAASYTYDERAKVIAPKPGSTIVAFSSEYIDRYQIAAFPGLRAGFFDRGDRSERPVQIMAVGDSFTRGVGSVEWAQFNWVDRMEDMLGQVAVVNLGHQGSGTRQQLTAYRNLAPFIRHDIVLLNFFTGGDFVDNAYKDDLGPTFVDYLPVGTDPDAVITAMQQDRIYDAGCAAIAATPVRVKTWLVTGKLISTFFPTLYARIPDGMPVCPSPAGTARRGLPASISSLTPVAVAAIETARRNHPDKGALIDDHHKITVVRQGGFDFNIHDYASADPKDGDVIAVSAEEIVKFVAEVRANGKIPLVILHPSKGEVYAPLLQANRIETAPSLRSRVLSLKFLLGLKTVENHGTKETLPDMAITDGPRMRLKKMLPADVEVFDMTEDMRSAALSSDVNLYWEVDTHYTPAGYLYAGSILCHFLAKRIGQAADGCGMDRNLLEQAKRYAQMKISKRE